MEALAAVMAADMEVVTVVAIPEDTQAAMAADIITEIVLQMNPAFIRVS